MVGLTIFSFQSKGNVYFKLHQIVTIKETGDYSLAVEYKGDNTTGVCVKPYIELADYRRDINIYPSDRIWTRGTLDISLEAGTQVDVGIEIDSPEIMGLCLTYNVNCGLSTRKTSQVLKEVHGIKISHVQVANYAYTASLIIKPFVDNFDYQPSNFLAADETYTKVKGSKRYVWFVMDAIKKSILGYHSSEYRDTIPCILTLRMAFDKFKEFPGKALKFVADGYNSYKLAQQQFKLHNMDFDVTQVIGLTNEDPVSTEYRWLK